MKKCRYCNRKMSKTLEKRFHHFAANHPDILLGMGLRIARDPRGFGEAVAGFVRQGVSNGRLLSMVEKEGMF